MSYRPELLDREVRLAITQLSLLADWAIGDGAGLRMLDLPSDSLFPESRHPDELPAVGGFEIGRRVSNLEAYVHGQRWMDSIPEDIRTLSMTVQWIFSPAVVADYEAEKASGKFDTVPGPFEPGAGDVPLGYFHGGQIEMLVALAAARLKVDQDEPLTMGEIALLTGKRDGTIATTVYRKVFATYEQDGKRYAAISEVLAWLKQNGYQPTLVQSEASRSAPAPIEAYLFVPVASDGSIFAPSCASGGRFTVGEKGAEQKVDGYFQALQILQRMATPRWRRPGPKGVPEPVTGIRFERMSQKRVEAA